MIASLWDLKPQFVACPLFVKSDYHDSFPMGFETSILIQKYSTQFAIMIGSLWDLKLAIYPKSPKTKTAIMIGSLWDLKRLKFKY